MKEGYALAFGAKSGYLVDESDAVRFALPQRTVKILNGETDVMDPWTSSGDELANRGIGGAGLKKFDQCVSGDEAGDLCAIGVIEGHLDHPEDVAVEGQDLVERFDGETNVGDTGAAWCGICHDRKNFSGGAMQLAAYDR